MFLAIQIGTPNLMCHCCQRAVFIVTPFVHFPHETNESLKISFVYSFSQHMQGVRIGCKMVFWHQLAIFAQRRVAFYITHRHTSSNTSRGGDEELFPCCRPERPFVGCRLTHTSVTWEWTCWIRPKDHSALSEYAQENVRNEKYTMRILYYVFSQIPATSGLGKIVINSKCSEDGNKAWTRGGGQTKEKWHGAGHL